MLPTRILYVGAGLMAAALVTAGANVMDMQEIRRGPFPQDGRDFSPAAVKRLVVDGVWTSVNSLGELLNSGLDLLICNLMLYPAAMGAIGSGKDHLFHLRSMLWSYPRPFSPCF